MDFRGKNIDLVGKIKLWFGISLAVMVIGFVSLMAFGLNLGIDFKGGSQLTYRIPEKLRPAAGQEAPFLEKVNEAIQEGKLLGTKTQIVGGQDLSVQTRALTQAELASQEPIIGKAVSKVFGTANATPEGREFVGAVIGRELRNNAIYGVIFGVLGIATWIYIRYNFAGEGQRYAVAGIVALLHDVFVLVGIFALIGGLNKHVEIDGTFIAALLTVVGYSINDSVVIFDRLRENLRNRRREDYEKVVNDSLLETMSRSINTGMTVLIMLFVLLIFGGESVFNFTLAMLIGIASGLYSSIFNASMVLVAWHRWEQKRALSTPGAPATTGNRASVTVRDTSRSSSLKRAK